MPLMEISMPVNDQYRDRLGARLRQSGLFDVHPTNSQHMEWRMASMTGTSMRLPLEYKELSLPQRSPVAIHSHHHIATSSRKAEEARRLPFEY